MITSATLIIIAVWFMAIKLITSLICYLLADDDDDLLLVVSWGGRVIRSFLKENTLKAHNLQREFAYGMKKFNPIM